MAHRLYEEYLVVVPSAEVDPEDKPLETDLLWLKTFLTEEHKPKSDKTMLKNANAVAFCTAALAALSGPLPERRRRLHGCLTALQENKIQVCGVGGAGRERKEKRKSVEEECGIYHCPPPPTPPPTHPVNTHVSSFVLGWNRT
jgi:hypothetical protein